MIFLKFFSLIPFRALYLISDIFYFLLWKVFKYRNEVIRDNLRKAFPEKNEQELEEITKAYYKNLTDLSLESFKMLTISKKQLNERVRITNLDLPRSYLQKEQSIIVLTGHQCNWEWLLLSCCLHGGFPVDAIYKPMHIKSLDRFFLYLRTRFGAHAIPMKDTLREVVKRKNIVRAIALVADQTPPGGEVQYWTEFLNQDTPFFVGPDKLARFTGFPVLFLTMRRVRRGYYEATFSLLQEAPFEKEGFPVIEKYSKALEKSIRQYPADWLWSHRRWKSYVKKERKAVIGNR